MADPNQKQVANITADSPIAVLMNKFAGKGIVCWIGLRPGPRKPMSVVQNVKVTAGQGLEGDRYKSVNGKRQVTLIQQEHLEAVASFLDTAEVDPAVIRRNIVVKGINLLALKDKRFKLGSAILETTGECHPCSRMEMGLGEGGYNAMRGHGGITAAVVESGTIQVGDQLSVLD